MKKILPYLLLAPMIIIMGALVFYPVIMTFSYSLKQWKLTAPNEISFIGLDNYVDILKSDSFWYSFQNTLFILLVVVALTLIIGVFAAIFLSVDTRLSGLMLAVMVLPWALPPYVNGVLWKFIFHSGYGFLNKLLMTLHIVEQPVEWLSSRWSLLLIISIVVAWRSIPFTAIVCLAGRKSLPSSLYEAAKIDGAAVFGFSRALRFP